MAKPMKKKKHDEFDDDMDDERTDPDDDWN